jgi:hypothetical protein
MNMKGKEQAKLRFSLVRGCVRASGKFPETKRGAMKAAIKKWEFIVRTLKTGKPIQKTGGTYTCALCQLYFGDDCAGCPISEHTEQPGCLGTPHEQIEHEGLDLEKAKQELKFLREIKAITERDNEHR